MNKEIYQKNMCALQKNILQHGQIYYKKTEKKKF